jgi:hypothetical protein
MAVFISMRSAFIPYEIKRMLKSRFTQIIILLVAVSPLLGALLSPYLMDNIVFGMSSTTLLSEIILYPAKFGAVLSSLAFIALTVYEYDKIRRFSVHSLIEPIASAVKLTGTRMIAILCAGLLATVGAMVIMLPYMVLKMGSFNSFLPFLFSYSLIMYGAIVLASLMTAGFYLLFRNVNLTCIMMFLAVLFSFLAGIIDYQYMWVQTGAGGLSEYFGSGNTFAGIGWNRLFGFSVALLLYLFGMWSDRCYNKGLFKSLIQNSRRSKWLPAGFLIALVGVWSIYQHEPIFKTLTLTDLTYIVVSGDKETPVNPHIRGTSTITVQLEIAKDNKATGVYEQELHNGTDQVQNLYFELAEGYRVSDIKFDNVALPYTPVSPKNLNSAKLRDVYEISLPPSSKAKLSIRYTGRPKIVSTSHDFAAGINQAYVSMAVSSFAPLVCVGSNDKTIEGTIKLDSTLTVITQGVTNRRIAEQDGTTTWSFSCDALADFILTAGQYGVFERTVLGTHVEFFYPLAASAAFESRGQDTLDIFSFFSEAFGPIGSESLKVVVTSGGSGGGGIQSGNISYVSEDTLIRKRYADSSQAASSDSFALLTHEIAHQWWGGGIDASNAHSRDPLDRSHDEWSNEALADFSTYLFLKHQFGQDYAEALLVDKWEKGTNELKRNFYQRNPLFINKLSMIPKYYVSLSLRQNKIYALGPLSVYTIYNQIGEERFDKAMKAIYDDYYRQPDNKLSFSAFLKMTGAKGGDWN